MTRSLTLFFIVEAPGYQYKACYLAASIREHLDPDIELVGYCPAERRDKLDPAVIETLARLGCEVRTFETDGKFRTPYPHGNKLLACLEPRQTAFSGFLDSDIIFVRDQDISTWFKDGHVACSPATSMGWADQSIWDEIYRHLEMPFPTERIQLMRKKKPLVVPYFSSGVVYFPEDHRNAAGQSFAEVWMDTALRIDALDSVPQKRPYLDQLSLPLAIKRADLTWNPLPEEQNFYLGGRMRHKTLPKTRAICTVHYRHWAFLEEAKLRKTAYQMLQNTTGARRIKKVPLAPMPDAAKARFAKIQ